jgi:RNA polymerase sigma-70 factor (ECF subfamily)
LPSDFDVEAVAEDNEFRALVQKAIKALPDRHRTMIVMRDVQDLSYTEISDLLGLPEGTIKSRINRARRNLRDIFLASGELKDYINVKKIGI